MSHLRRSHIGRSAGLCLAGLLASSPAAIADSDKGVLVRLETGGAAVDSPVVVTLTPEAGDPIELTLLDDGNPPDVTAGDGVWSAAVLTEQDAFDVRLSLGDGAALTGGEVRWDPDQIGARDLVIRLDGDQI
ncbi:MAG: hypothetical protein D6798_00735, partial [Deltaproteobacteria bacterium]